MKINGISASSYDCYSLCAWKWYLTYVLGFSDVSSPAAFAGTLIHKALEILSRAAINNHPRDSKIFDAQYLWDICFNHYYNLEPSTAEQLDNAKLKKICQGYYELLNGPYTPIRDNTISAEDIFNIPIQEPEFKIKGADNYFTLRGRIDRIDKINDDTIEVIDYKSGSRVNWSSPTRSKKTPEDLFEDIQPKMYHLAAKHLYPWAKNVIVTFIYFTDGGAVSVPFSDEDIEETKSILKKRLRAIESNLDPQQSKSWKCKNFCYFGDKSGICDNVWDEKEECGHKFIEQKYTMLNVRRKSK